MKEDVLVHPFDLVILTGQLLTFSAVSWTGPTGREG